MEKYQAQVDEQEQLELGQTFANVNAESGTNSTPEPGLRFDHMSDNMDIDEGNADRNQEELHADAEFDRYLDELRANPDVDTLEPNDDTEELDCIEEADPVTAYLPSNTFGSGGADAPRRDILNNTYVRIVHSNGIHHMALVTCQCHGTDHHVLDLLGSRLLPASFQKIRTLFTTHLLDMFRLCNLELKASAYQFYRLLRRQTQPMAPAGVVNLYTEFRRMSRLWRWTKKLKWAGFAGHNTKSALDVKNGELANFCPACPQVNINIPPNWQDDTNQYVYRRMFVADGNFKADHVREKTASQDVWLSDGGGFIPKQQEYFDFLRTALADQHSKAPCENTFRAIANALQSSKACDVTGVVAIACAWHGCYAPTSVCDLFKGEQQKNVDFAFMTALRSTNVHPKQGVMLLYDIICQYLVYLWLRLARHLDPNLTIEAAIGMFHVHAHKDQCFFRYAPSFIPGAGCVCGEILESLWSALNSISLTARTATLAHRAEMLDDHISDSNHNKMLGMVNFLTRRHWESKENKESCETHFKKVESSVDSALIDIWTNDIQHAESVRSMDRSVMDIYAAGKSDDFQELVGDLSTETGTAVQLWLNFALTIEEQQ